MNPTDDPRTLGERIEEVARASINTRIGGQTEAARIIACGIRAAFEEYERIKNEEKKESS